MRRHGHQNPFFSAVLDGVRGFIQGVGGVARIVEGNIFGRDEKGLFGNLIQVDDDYGSALEGGIAFHQRTDQASVRQFARFEKGPFIGSAGTVGAVKHELSRAVLVDGEEGEFVGIAEMIPAAEEDLPAGMEEGIIVVALIGGDASGFSQSSVGLAIGHMQLRHLASFVFVDNLRPRGGEYDAVVRYVGGVDVVAHGLVGELDEGAGFQVHLIEMPAIAAGFAHAEQEAFAVEGDFGIERCAPIAGIVGASPRIGSREIFHRPVGRYG